MVLSLPNTSAMLFSGQHSISLELLLLPLSYQVAPITHTKMLTHQHFCRFLLTLQSSVLQGRCLISQIQTLMPLIIFGALHREPPHTEQSSLSRHVMGACCVFCTSLSALLHEFITNPAMCRLSCRQHAKPQSVFICLLFLFLIFDYVLSDSG